MTNAAKNGTATAASYYSLLNVDHDATIEDIHRAYKKLSTTFHPDKFPRTTSDENKENIQQVFLEFKLANDVLTDPVLRMAYDMYGEEAVNLIKRIQQQQREQQKRRAAAAAAEMERDEDDPDDNDEHEEDQDDNLYERLERLVATNPLQAREELQIFMEQFEYHQRLLQESQVQLSCTMDFPPVVDLETLVGMGRNYLLLSERQLTRLVNRVKSQDELDYLNDRVKAERRLVDYQVNRIREAQKAEVGIALTCVQLPFLSGATNMAATGSHHQTLVKPKWSMSMGGSTDLVYPNVAQIVKVLDQEPLKQEHLASVYTTLSYQPVPETQVYMTANLSCDDAHQFVLGSSRTFVSRTSFRYNLTFLPKAPLASPVIFNMVSARHIKKVGMASGGLSVVGNGDIVQANLKLEAVGGAAQNHKCSAKVSMEGRSGLSLVLGYKCHFQKKSTWFEQYLPKRLDLSVTLGKFQKVSAMVTHEFTSLATSPTLGFGMEHELDFGCWKWIWEWTYQNSKFRIPVPVLYLGSVVDPSAYYLPKLYAGIYFLWIQSLLARLLQEGDEQQQQQDDEEKGESEKDSASRGALLQGMAMEKILADSERQVALMTPVAERKRYQEQARNGLVILRAAYWMETKETTIGLRPPRTKLISMDATTQLQFWVVQGKLLLPSIPKSCWLGFYNLQTEEGIFKNSLFKKQQQQRWDWRFWRRWTRHPMTPQSQLSTEPQLTIRYSYDGYVYEITVGEQESVDLPNNDKAQLLGLASVVQ